MFMEGSLNSCCGTITGTGKSFGTFCSVSETKDQRMISSSNFGYATASDFAYGGFLVRPLVRADLPILVSTLGPTIEALYPNGLDSMYERLNRSLDGRGFSMVASSSSSPHVPIALSSEIDKGCRRVKLSTFWVSPNYRKRGVGRRLLEHRIISWLQADLESVHVTVRREREEELRGLMDKYGFRRVAIDLSRYGEAQDEVVLQWKPEWCALQMPDSANMLRFLA
jgi:ribosomal protein S18 acetylase RimI-like enzyme